MTGARPTRRPRSWVLLLAVVVWSYGGAVPEAAIVLLFERSWNWAEAAVRGLGPMIGWGLVLSLQRAGVFPTREAQRRRRGAPDTATAIATGHLPPDADPGRWRPELTTEARELDQVRRLVLLSGGGGAALVAVAAAVADGGGAGAWAVAAVLLVSSLALHRRLTGMVGSARRLLDELPGGR